ncbi:hypothetical protein [Lactiplantibacillus mudanjiangensis]|uniref:Uncharacterized protein n=1 Tax=Lactiplantibacillus mudanjiangensis TaxID=1296538 RepID=A0A660DYB8_9LACO|nr:hypothetical protein [Lactiplantibacillus mudanjiangensis]VDG19528.1 hypothetical protein [Lactobacillus alimentarius DSM 20249] [Lactiplantibacillus mudanjiangensis]VDG23359.1 hypothetical protein [Lactobacillus alimentarius DSM 20249] [Lactiplantibacillus mudanjiangensis]VDG28758.1 hypothetical protein [Lactobacillus alimentarius DSM 20249] [Lactiplantibacillus mudanjiangensis]VDG30978.1 hypothetical protein [Lactobacillus alimentarius DSM 20249] [Lactiplantibacillus mudanjiangensis]
MILLNLLNLALVWIVIRNVVFESQLELKARYRWGQLIVAGLLVAWGANGGLASLSDLLFWSLFMLMNVMMGHGGLTATKLVLPGSWVRRTVTLDQITAINIAIIPAIDEKSRVIVKFVLGSRRQINMVFNGTAAAVKSAIQERVGTKIAIEVSKLE